MSTDDYQPNSVNAMFSRLISRLDNQDHEAGLYRADVRALLAEIRSEVKKTNGRVTALERWKDTVTAKVAVVAFIASGLFGFLAWFVPLLIKK